MSPAAFQAGLGWSKAREYTRKTKQGEVPLGGLTAYSPLSGSFCIAEDLQLSRRRLTAGYGSLGRESVTGAAEASLTIN